MQKPTVALVTEYSVGIDFECHVEDGAVVIDKCEGIAPEDALGIFPAWALEAMGATKR